MSFEQAMLRAQSLPPVATTRAILWLNGIGDPRNINKKGSESLQQSLNRLDGPATGIKVMPSIVSPGYYVDSVHVTENRDRALQVLVEATETALLTTLQPAEVSEARLSQFVDAQEPWNAWEVLNKYPDSDVSHVALAIAEDTRAALFEKAMGITFQ